MNHQAIVAKIDSLQEIAGANNIQVAFVLGEQVIVSKTAQVGDVGILFPAELQLSTEFCHNNNLFRDKSQNKDKEKAGFFDANRRVRVQPFMKVKSQAYFTGFESLDYIGKLPSMDIGFSFDEINGHKICQKYISEATRAAIAKNKEKKVKAPPATPYFEKHVDSAQFKHMANMIQKGSLIHIHAKRHGTSQRVANTLVNIDLPWWKKTVNKVINLFPIQKWDIVVGTRNVVLNSPDKSGFHGSEAFRFEVAESLRPHLEKGMTVYGEICGYANGKPIMARGDAKATKDKAFIKKYGETITYSYGCKEHEYRFHIYRITYLNHENKNVDFTQAQLESWCEAHGFEAPLNVCEPFIYNGNVDSLRTLVENLTERPECLAEDYIDSTHNGEGVILRVDDGSFTPKFYKNKAYHFKVMEGIAEVVDTEDAA